MEIHVADTETTGVTDLDEIVEFAFIHIDEQLKIHESFEARVKPGIPISAEASATNGITNEMVRDCPTMAEVMAELKANTTLEFEDVMLIAHNGHFDERKLKPFWGITAVLDTCRACQQMYPDAPNHKLQTMKDYLGLRQDQAAHSAMGDIVLLYDLLKQLLSDSGMGLMELHAELIKPVKHEVMPFGKHKGKPIKAVPSGYIWWIKKNFDDPYGDLKLTFGW